MKAMTFHEFAVAFQAHRKDLTVDYIKTYLRNSSATSSPWCSWKLIGGGNHGFTIRKYGGKFESTVHHTDGMHPKVIGFVRRSEVMRNMQ